jgi:histidine triad (HIT) family protein
MNNSENLEQIRKGLINQIENTFPEESKEESKQQILAMNEEELINFLKQNGLIKEETQEGEENSGQKCVFCSIASREIPSTSIGENDKALAILDINPVSEGHTLIIPKEHISNVISIPEEAKNLAKQIAEKLNKIFNPKKIEITPSEAMGHFMINVFPVYENESLTSARKRKSPQELAELKSKVDSYQEEIKKPLEEIKQEIPQIQQFNEKNFWLPKRRP